MVDIPGIGKFTREQAEAIAAKAALERNPALADLITNALNPQAGKNLQKPTKNILEKEQLNTIQSLARLSEVKKNFKKEFQQIFPRLGFAWTSLKSKFDIGTITPKERKQAVEYAKHRRSGIENINRYIKEITGAQMSEAEATRLKLAQPDPGAGIFNGDSPLDFEGKLDGAIASAKMARARLNYLRKNGLVSGPRPFDGPAGSALAEKWSLDRMSGIINQRRDEILKEISGANPQFGTRELLPIVKQRLQAEFFTDA